MAKTVRYITPRLQRGVVSCALLSLLLAVLPRAAAYVPAAPAAPAQRVNCDVVVVGGGPAGLAAALMLARRGYRDIHVIEKNGPGFFEVDKAYLYRIDARGQRLTNLLDVTRQLPDVSVTTAEFLDVTRVQADGTVKVVPTPADPTQLPAYWLPRRVLIQFLVDRVAEQPGITVHYNSAVSSLTMPASVDDPEGVATVSVTGEGGGVTEYCSQRVLGCDGINSKIRLGLKQWATEQLGEPDRFGLVEVDSLSAGLRYKILTLQPRFPLQAGSDVRTDSMTCYSYVGVKRSRIKAPLRLGLLPYKLPDVPRTANIIARPDSPVFGLSSAAAVLDFLRAEFPQCDVEAMVSREEAERFAQSTGGYFPKPQYCRTLYQSIGGARGGVVLLGDAIHAFPPDLGAGVNSAFDDVFDLNTVLDQSKDDWAAALPQYQPEHDRPCPSFFSDRGLTLQALRLPESRAICELIPVGYPHQYNHLPIRTRFKLLTIGARLLLSRVLPWAFDPPVFLMIQDCRYKYAEVLRRATRTTRRLKAIALLLALSLVAVQAAGGAGPAGAKLAEGARHLLTRVVRPAVKV